MADGPSMKKSYSSFDETCTDDSSRCTSDDSQERLLPNFEDVIESMGPPGRYQILQCLMISANFIPVMFVSASYVFTGLQPSFLCSPVNETTLLKDHSRTTNDLVNTTYQHHVTYEACDIRVTSYTNTSGPTRAVDTRTFGCLNGHDFTGGDDVSIVTEWDLVCGLAGIAEVAQSVIPLGWGIGIMIASILSDKFGRKQTIVMCAILSFVFILGSAFAPNIYVFIVLRFLSGLVGPGISAITFVLGAELFVSKQREMYCQFNGAVVSSCMVLLCTIAYILRGSSWRELQLCLGVVSIFPVLVMYFVDESATWLYSKGKYQQATKIIQKACRMNGLDFDEINKTWNELRFQETKQQQDGKTNAGNHNIFYIFKNKKLRVYAAIGWIIFFTNDASYFGMLFTASTLSGSLYLNTALMALFEFPALFVGYFVIKYRGRRFALISAMSMAAVCLLLSTCLQNVAGLSTLRSADTAATGVFIIGRLAIANSYTILYITVSELFPTTLRSSGMGLSVLGGCVGGIAAPFLLPLHGLLPWMPGTCLIALLVVSALLTLTLPETKGIQLPSNA